MPVGLFSHGKPEGNSRLDGLVLSPNVGKSDVGFDASGISSYESDAGARADGFDIEKAAWTKFVRVFGMVCGPAECVIRAAVVKPLSDLIDATGCGYIANNTSCDCMMRRGVICSSRNLLLVPISPLVLLKGGTY